MAKGSDVSFTTIGYSNWKRAKESKHGFNVHMNSDCHKAAMIAWTDFKQMESAGTSISQIVSEAQQRVIKENRYYIKTVGEILLLTAKQDIAQRGHRENEQSMNKGNFLEILNLVQNHDQAIAKKIKEMPKNAKYTSPEIQNEVLHILADIIRKEIIEEVKESGEFSLIVDETKDVSKTEQISIVLRYYYGGSVKESFLHFVPADKLDAKSLIS